MKVIITIILTLSINLLMGQDDLVKITSGSKTTIAAAIDMENLESDLLSSFESIKDLQELAALSSLEQLSALESLEGLQGLEGLEGLQGLEGLKGLKALDALSATTVYNVDCLSSHSDDGSKHKGEKKEHRIAMSSGQLILEGLGQVSITGYSGSEIVITRSMESDEEHDERAMGLRVVNSLGLDDNTGLGLNATKSGSDLSITQVSKSCCDDDLEIKVPFGISLDISNNVVGAGDIDISDIKDEIVISTSYGDVNLDKVTGPLAIKTVYGSIEAVMDDISSEGSITLYSVYGLLDFTIPQGTKSDIEISTPYGEILTNVDIDIASTSGMKRLSSKKMRGTTNGGGLDISLKSGYKNVYLRNK